MKKIKLTGKHAVGKHRYATVDDDLYDQLSSHNWKAKPNGSNNHIYAIRVQRCADGVSRDVRMHRVVLGYDGPLDVDHINRNALDNRRENLRVVDRGTNLRNRGSWDRKIACPVCGMVVLRPGKVSSERPSLCAACRKKAKATRTCQSCGKRYETHSSVSRYCSDACRKREKRKRQIAQGSLPHSQTPEVMRAYLARHRERRRVV